MIHVAYNINKSSCNINTKINKNYYFLQREKKLNAKLQLCSFCKCYINSFLVFWDSSTTRLVRNGFGKNPIGRLPTRFYLSNVCWGTSSSIIADYLSSPCNLLSVVNQLAKLTSESRATPFHIRPATFLSHRKYRFTVCCIVTRDTARLSGEFFRSQFFQQVIEILFFLCLTKLKRINMRYSS